MSILTIIPLFVLGFLGKILFAEVPWKRTILIWLWALSLLVLGMFTGFRFGEIKGLYQVAFMEQFTVEVNQEFVDGRDDDIAEAFQQAQVAHEKGKSSYSALNGVLRDLCTQTLVPGPQGQYTTGNRGHASNQDRVPGHTDNAQGLVHTDRP